MLSNRWTGEYNVLQDGRKQLSPEQQWYVPTSLVPTWYEHTIQSISSFKRRLDQSMDRDDRWDG